jgi:LysM repeat protein
MKTYLFQSIIVCLCISFLSSCSSQVKNYAIKREQSVLGIEDVYADVEDNKYKLNQYKVELQILENRINEQTKLVNQLHHLFDKVNHDTKRINDQQINIIESLKKLDKRQVEFGDDLKSLFSKSKNFNSSISEIQSNLSQVKNVKSSLENVIGKLQNSNELSYTVKSGDSLDLIARRHNVSIEALKKANKLKSDLIIVGQKIRIPQ